MTVRQGMRGRIDGLVFWQKRLLDCEVAGDYNCGRLSTLPAPNKFFTGPGGSHRVPATIISSTRPTLSVGEWAIWRDTGTNTDLLIYNDATVGEIGVELGKSGSL